MRAQITFVDIIYALIWYVVIIPVLFGYPPGSGGLIAVVEPVVGDLYAWTVKLIEFFALFGPILYMVLKWAIFTRLQS